MSLECTLIFTACRHDGLARIVEILLQRKRNPKDARHVVFQNHFQASGIIENLNMKAHRQKLDGRNNLRFIDLAMRRFKWKRAIKITEEAKNTHVVWVKFLKENPDYPNVRAGDIEHQEKWIKKYDMVLDFLKEENND